MAVPALDPVPVNCDRQWWGGSSSKLRSFWANLTGNYPKMTDDNLEYSDQFASFKFGWATGYSSLRLFAVVTRFEMAMGCVVPIVWHTQNILLWVVYSIQSPPNLLMVQPPFSQHIPKTFRVSKHNQCAASGWGSSCRGTGATCEYLIYFDIAWPA